MLGPRGGACMRVGPGGGWGDGWGGWCWGGSKCRWGVGVGGGGDRWGGAVLGKSRTDCTVI